VGDLKAIESAYLELTGFRLVTSRSDAATSDQITVQPATSEQMEINAAYDVIRSALNPLGLYRAGLKQGQIVLTFISPQVGERHRETIIGLAEEIGYTMVVHPHPNQQQILQIASALAREAGWSVRKGPGIHVDRAEVTISLAEPPDEMTLEQVNAEFVQRTGYCLVVG